MSIRVGVVVITLILPPVLGAVLQPIFTEVSKAGLCVTATLNEVTAESGEHLSDLIVEAKIAYVAGKTGHFG